MVYYCESGVSVPPLAAIGLRQSAGVDYSPCSNIFDDCNVILILIHILEAVFLHFMVFFSDKGMI